MCQYTACKHCSKPGAHLTIAVGGGGGGGGLLPSSMLELPQNWTVSLQEHNVIVLL